MEKLKINIHPTFLLFACILIYFGKSGLFFIYLFVIILHEMAHAIVARRLGYNISNIKLIPFGICLNINSFSINPKDEIKIALAGPIFNFGTCLITVTVWWIFPEFYNYSYLFCYANFVTFIFNLIPAFPLDGGRILRVIFKIKSTDGSAIKYCKLVNIIISVLLVGMFCWSLFGDANFTYLFVSFCVLSGAFDKSEKQKYSYINFSLRKKHSKILKVKEVVFEEQEQLYKACRYIDGFSYLKILILDKNKIICKEIYENEFLNLLEKNACNQTFKDILNIKSAKTSFYP